MNTATALFTRKFTKLYPKHARLNPEGRIRCWIVFRGFGRSFIGARTTRRPATRHSTIFRSKSVPMEPLITLRSTNGTKFIVSIWTAIRSWPFSATSSFLNVWSVVVWAICWKWRNRIWSTDPLSIYRARPKKGDRWLYRFRWIRQPKRSQPVTEVWIATSCCPSSSSRNTIWPSSRFSKQQD